MKKNLIILILLLALAGGLSFYLKHSVIIVDSPTTPQPTIILDATVTPDEIPVPTTTMNIKIALLKPQTENANKSNFRGCDIVDLQSREVSKSNQPLEAALKELFLKKDAWSMSEGKAGSFISTQKELFFDRVILENEVARIYLIGKTGPLGGVCDDPRIRIQLEETALQFPTVKKVEYFLNGVKTDLTFSQKGV